MAQISEKNIYDSYVYLPCLTMLRKRHTGAFNLCLITMMRVRNLRMDEFLNQIDWYILHTFLYTAIMYFFMIRWHYSAKFLNIFRKGGKESAFKRSSFIFVWNSRKK